MEVITSEVFKKWLHKLRDDNAVTEILTHIDRMKLGNLGKVKNVGGNVFEKKIYYGPGYRLYFANKNGQLIVILCGGDKSTQQKDIEKAKIIAKEM